jgi:hypothetical protein
MIPFIGLPSPLAGTVAHGVVRITSFRLVVYRMASFGVCEFLLEFGQSLLDVSVVGYISDRFCRQRVPHSTEVRHGLFCTVVDSSANHTRLRKLVEDGGFVKVGPSQLSSCVPGEATALGAAESGVDQDVRLAVMNFNGSLPRIVVGRFALTVMSAFPWCVVVFVGVMLRNKYYVSVVMLILLKRRVNFLSVIGGNRC